MLASTGFSPGRPAIDARPPAQAAPPPEIHTVKRPRKARDPLHTNGSQNDIRALVTKRKISGGTVGEAGKIARDTMLDLMKTCAKLGVSYYRFLGNRFHVPGVLPVPSLAGLIAQAAG
ncbi:hypothetical protein [Sphingomonas abietis]|uniref:Uncharacterized protein n=1 Tax=Sphingomonas abietis TaxID=3012344 RepID=A0ABY7NS49_9SPHN|nr:hypothetical protein [Sphingomonas abietis]WBO24384.1 hypothetical protein PBT88_09915 [Sphingomonas abietis]